MGRRAPARAVRRGLASRSGLRLYRMCASLLFYTPRTRVSRVAASYDESPPAGLLGLALRAPRSEHMSSFVLPPCVLHASPIAVLYVR